VVSPLLPQRHCGLISAAPVSRLKPFYRLIGSGNSWLARACINYCVSTTAANSLDPGNVTPQLIWPTKIFCHVQLTS
jgi:hypothetical protein